jgi:hypothetical protein
MTTVTDEDVQQRDGRAIPKGGRRLIASHFDGFDLEVLGVHYHADGGGFDLTRGPSDAKGLTALLGRATAVLRRLGSAARSEATTVGGELQELEQRTEERLHRWFARLVRHLIRKALGHLARLAGKKLRESTEQKKAHAKAPQSGQRPSSARHAAPGKGKDRRAGAPRPRSTGNGRRGQPQQRSKVAQTARKTVRKLPREQTARLARGLAPEESAGIAAQLHVGEEKAAPLIHELEDAAKELVTGSPS